MANDYVLFATAIYYDSEEQRDWLLTELGQGMENDLIELHTEYTYEDHPECSNIHVWSDGEENPDELAEIVAEFQLKFNIADPWMVETAYTCAKPRAGSFGGALTIVHKGSIFVLGTEELGVWLARELQVGGLSLAEVAGKLDHEGFLRKHVYVYQLEGEDEKGQ